MAAKPKAKTVAFTSAKGTAQYPWLNKADFQYNTEGRVQLICVLQMMMQNH